MVVGVQQKMCSISVYWTVHCCAAVQVWQVGSLAAESSLQLPVEHPAGCSSDSPGCAGQRTSTLFLPNLPSSSLLAFRAALPRSKSAHRGKQGAQAGRKRPASGWQLGWLQTPPQGGLLPQGSSCGASTPLGRQKQTKSRRQQASTTRTDRTATS